jgi:hypothetical protein
MLEIAQRVVRLKLIVPAMAGLLALLAPTARADSITYLVSVGNNIGEQTSNNSASPGVGGAYYFVSFGTTSPDPYTSASLAVNGGTSQSLFKINPTQYFLSSSGYSTLAEMEAAYPTTAGSSYTISTNGSPTVTFVYSGDDYPSDPYLTGTDYTSLQGMNAAQPFTFHFSTLSADSTSGSFQEIGFAIYDLTTSTHVVSDGIYQKGGPLPSSTTSFFLPGGTLTGGDQYQYQITYQNSDPYPNGTCSGGCDGGDAYPPALTFDEITEGTFTAAPVPEPRSYAPLLAAGFAGMLILRRRRRARLNVEESI